MQSGTDRAARTALPATRQRDDGRADRTAGSSFRLGRSSRPVITDSGVMQQPARDEWRDRIHARPVVDADDSFRCPAAAMDIERFRVTR